MPQRIFSAMFSIAVLVTLVAQPCSAQGKGKGHNNDQGQSVSAQVVFSPWDQEIIRDYYRSRNSNLPPGLAKRDRLPPGLQKHLERDGTLPPGLQKRVESFPPDLEQRLPPLPKNCRRGAIGVDIVILDRRTQRIMDVIHDILRP